MEDALIDIGVILKTYNAAGHNLELSNDAQHILITPKDRAFRGSFLYSLAVYCQERSIAWSIGASRDPNYPFLLIEP